MTSRARKFISASKIDHRSKTSEHFTLQGLRPVIPKGTNPKLAQLLEKCWQQSPLDRPNFTEILQTLNDITEEVNIPALIISL